MDKDYLIYQLTKILKKTPSMIFSTKGLQGFLIQLKDDKELPRSLKYSDFLECLLTIEGFQEKKINCLNYDKEEKRYI